MEISRFFHRMETSDKRKALVYRCGSVLENVPDKSIMVSDCAG
jgi:hypothetical protein